MKKFLLSLININNMNIQKMKQMILEYQQKYKTTPIHDWKTGILINWEFKLLTDIKAISNMGIVAHYPVVRIAKENGETTVIDLDGNLVRTKQAVEDFNNNGNKGTARVLFYPQNFQLFKQAKKELLDEKIIEQKLVISN